MRKLLLTAAALAASLFFGAKADAMPLNGGLGTAADGLSAIEKTQFFYLGREYCWYPDGWHGPGFYWCGYEWRPGFGWGGPWGWRGWRGGPRVFGPRVGGPRFVGPRRGFVAGPRVMGPRMMGPRPGGGGGGGGGVRRH